MKYLLIFEVLLLLFIAADCKKNPIVPPTPPPPDTTSHNFTFTQYEFGSSPSSFSDVAIVNDSDIWAVGAINEATDSMYNAAHWDGIKWTLKKIAVSFRGNIITPSLDGAFAFSPTDIWFVGSLPIHGDGQNWDIFDLRSMLGFDSLSLSKGWGTSSQSIYFVGNGGSIAHYSNGTWTKMESGTTIDLRDVWGSSDGSIVWASGYSNDNSQSVLLKYDGTSPERTGWTTVWSSHPSAPPYGGLITSLWGGDSLFLVGTDGVFREDIAGKDSVQHLFSLTTFPYRIKGSAENNVAFVGDNAMIYHYNKTDWKLLNETNFDQPLYSVAVSRGLIVAVGADFNVTTSFPPKALIYLGRRMQ